MFQIETSGSWYEMGRQVGAAFGPELERCAQRFLALLPLDSEEVETQTAVVRARIEAHCPELIEETAGMAVGAGMQEARLFRYRLFVDIRAALQHNCSSFFAVAEDGAPWLGRTCDIEQEDHWCQLFHIRRPDEGVATACLTYLGMHVAVGMNEYGVGLVGGSSPNRDVGEEAGVPGSLLMHKSLQTCHNVEEVRELFTEQPVMGKGAALLSADADGASCLFDMAPGRRMIPVPRPEGKTWQACTNFFATADVPNADMPDYMYNAYARYGRISHQLEGGLAPRTCDGLKRLLGDVAQPGPYIPEGACPLETAYAVLFDLRNREIHLSSGNPNTTAFERKALHL